MRERDDARGAAQHVQPRSRRLRIEIARRIRQPEHGDFACEQRRIRRRRRRAQSAARTTRSAPRCGEPLLRVTLEGLGGARRRVERLADRRRRVNRRRCGHEAREARLPVGRRAASAHRGDATASRARQRRRAACDDRAVLHLTAGAGHDVQLRRDREIDLRRDAFERRRCHDQRRRTRPRRRRPHRRLLQLERGRGDDRDRHGRVDARVDWRRRCRARQRDVRLGRRRGREAVGEAAESRRARALDTERGHRRLAVAGARHPHAALGEYLIDRRRRRQQRGERRGIEHELRPLRRLVHERERQPIAGFDAMPVVDRGKPRRNRRDGCKQHAVDRVDHVARRHLAVVVRLRQPPHADRERRRVMHRARESGRVVAGVAVFDRERDRRVRARDLHRREAQRARRRHRERGRAEIDDARRHRRRHHHLELGEHRERFLGGTVSRRRYRSRRRDRRRAAAILCRGSP